MPIEESKVFQELQNYLAEKRRENESISNKGNSSSTDAGSTD